MLLPLRRPLRIVLVAPDIPGNTGAIGRICMATATQLHLVHPLGFDLSEKALRRAGLDYWPRVDVTEHVNWDAFAATADTDAQAWLLTTHAASRPHWEARFRPGDYILFGSETRGAAQAVHDWIRGRANGGDNHRISLPQVQEARSINLATAVSAALYEAVRQCQVAEQV